MAIRQRKGRRKPWEVYWNNPFTLKRESLYVETKEEAKKQDALKKYQLKYERELFQRDTSVEPKAEHTFESAYYLFLKDRRFSEEALKRHLRIMKHSLFLLGNTPVSQITVAKLDELIHHLHSLGIKNSSLKRYVSQVFSLIRWCVEKELIEEIPRFPRLPHIEYEHFIPPTQHELALMFEKAPQHLQRIIVLGSQMGIRVGKSELFRLRWEDVDLENRVIHLRAAKKNILEPVRDIPIRTSLIPILGQWYQLDRQSRIEYVINYCGKPVTHIPRAWKKMLIRAGITRRIRPYDLRHAFATEAIAAGADIGTVAKLMGHTDMNMILKHYQHVLSSQKRAAVEALPEPQYVAKNMWQTFTQKTNIQ